MIEKFVNNFFGFDPDFLEFNRVTSVKKPYTIKSDNDKAVIVHEALGIRPEDIDITLETVKGVTYLFISGETKNEVNNSNYSIKSRFTIDADRIDHIEKEAKDGLLYIEIYFKEAQKPKINIIDKQSDKKKLLG